jgi:hypothetical protein
LGSFANHLIEMLQQSATAKFPAIFNKVEQLHLKGDGFVKEAATIGLLEDLQNLNLHRKTNPGQFRPFLGPESERMWDALYQFWGDSPQKKGRTGGKGKKKKP